MLGAIKLLAQSRPVVYNSSSWAYAMLPILATILLVAVLVWTGSHPAQLVFHVVLEKITAQSPPATNRNLGKEQSMPEPTGMMQDRFHLDEALKVAKNSAPGWAINFDTNQHVGHKAGQLFENSLYQIHKFWSEVSFL